MTTNSFKKSAMGSAIALALAGGAASALAVPGVFFCTTANCGTGTFVTGIAWQEGSEVVLGGFNDAGAKTNKGATFLGQGFINTFTGIGAVQTDFYYVFSIPVSVSVGSGAVGSSITLIDPQATLPTASSGSNYFRMYHSAGIASTANYLSGIGAVPPGSLILEGAVFLDNNGSFTAPNKGTTATSGVITDASPTDIGTGSTTQGGNNIQTISVAGSGKLDVNVTFADAGYFRSNIDSLNLDIGQSIGLSDPFSLVTVPTRINGVLPNFGAASGGIVLNDTSCNGAPPCDMIFSSEASPNSKLFDTPLPEPGTLALLGLGMLGVGGFAARKKRS